MPRVLHIVCDSEKPWPAEFIEHQREQPKLEVRVFDFKAEPPDYRKLLQEIFEADSIEVW